MRYRAYFIRQHDDGRRADEIADFEAASDTHAHEMTSKILKSWTLLESICLWGWNTTLDRLVYVHASVEVPLSDTDTR